MRTLPAPNSDIHAEAEFREHLARVLTKRAVAAAAGSGAGLLQTWVHQLQASFSARRGAWLAEFLKRELLGDLPDEIQRAAELSSGNEFQVVQRCLQQLQQTLLS